MLRGMEPTALTIASLTAFTALGADALLAPRIRSRRWRERLTNVSCGVARYAVHGLLPLATLRLTAMALTHTRLRTPPWLDLFLNTPELHALHHSADPRHYDKNIGGILMLWDQLLGSYLPREPVARCGLPGPQARNAFEANWLPLRSIIRRSPPLATSPSDQRWPASQSGTT